MPTPLVASRSHVKRHITPSDSCAGSFSIAEDFDRRLHYGFLRSSNFRKLFLGQGSQWLCWPRPLNWVTWLNLTICLNALLDSARRCWTFLDSFSSGRTPKSLRLKPRENLRPSMSPRAHHLPASKISCLSNLPGGSSRFRFWIPLHNPANLPEFCLDLTFRKLIHLL